MFSGQIFAMFSYERSCCQVPSYPTCQHQQWKDSSRVSRHKSISFSGRLDGWKSRWQEQVSLEKKLVSHLSRKVHVQCEAWSHMGGEHGQSWHLLVMWQHVHVQCEAWCHMGGEHGQSRHLLVRWQHVYSGRLGRP